MICFLGLQTPHLSSIIHTHTPILPTQIYFSTHTNNELTFLKKKKKNPNFINKTSCAPYKEACSSFQKFHLSTIVSFSWALFDHKVKNRLFVLYLTAFERFTWMSGLVGMMRVCVACDLHFRFFLFSQSQIIHSHTMWKWHSTKSMARVENPCQKYHLIVIQSANVLTNVKFFFEKGVKNWIASQFPN